MKQLKSKTFVILIITIFILSLLTLFISILLIHIKFDMQSNWKKGNIHTTEPLLREEKTLYIGQRDISYNAYIIGGSKAGFLKPAILNKYSNNTFYNFFSTSGCFHDYDLYINYLLDKHRKDVKEIVLHLSTYETKKYSYENYIPSPIKKSLFSKIQLFKSYYLNIEIILDCIKKHSKKGENDSGIATSGEYYMNKSKDDYLTNPDNYVQNHVLKPCKDIKLLFTDSSKVSKSVCKKNVETLKQLKKLCDNNGTELKIVIGAHYIGMLSEIWGEDFNNYLRDLVNVNGKIWNFCGINNVNKNPYNFINEEHFWFFTGNKMIERMYAPVPNTTDLNAFGILLTKDNIEEYIQSQKEKWQELKTEYETTGTIKLQGIEDESYLGD